MLIDRELYMIMTHPRVGYRKFLEICVENQLPLVQLRDKSMSGRELCETVSTLTEIIRGSSTRLIVNDRPDIALMCGASGFHLGQDDLPLDLVREKFPESRNLVAGISTHSIEQAERAWAINPDYIGFGPVFPTTAKAVPDPAVGLESVSLIAERSPCPVVFIGGLFPENIADLIHAGARNVCMVRYMNEADDPARRIEEIRRMLRDG